MFISMLSRKFSTTVIAAATFTCPLSPQDLATLHIPYYGLDHKTHQGILVVNKNIQPQIIETFKDLYNIKFPIAKMEPLSIYHNNETQALEDNDTFAYSCRTLTGNNHLPSKHAYGLAIDINPVFNPYINGDTILPINGKPYLNRQLSQEGMITPYIDKHIFKKYGWEWGGNWKTLKDYQHIESSI